MMYIKDYPLLVNHLNYLYIYVQVGLRSSRVDMGKRRGSHARLRTTAPVGEAFIYDY